MNNLGERTFFLTFKCSLGPRTAQYPGASTLSSSIFNNNKTYNQRSIVLPNDILGSMEIHSNMMALFIRMRLSDLCPTRSRQFQ